MQDIYPISNKLVQRNERLQRLNQKPLALWLYGLPSSGKSTIAVHLEKKLFDLGYSCIILDGDNLRTGVNNNLGFSEEDRNENIRRAAEISKLFVESGIITINCFVCPFKSLRELAKSIIGPDDFVDIFVNAPLSTCKKRDTKNLYKKAEANLVPLFTGVSSPFENPDKTDLELHTDNLNIEETIQLILDKILPDISSIK